MGATLLWMERLEKIAEFRLVQRADVALEGDGIAIGDGRADMPRIRRSDGAILIIDGGACLVGPLACRRGLILTFHVRLVLNWSCRSSSRPIRAAD